MNVIHAKRLITYNHFRNKTETTQNEGLGGLWNRQGCCSDLSLKLPRFCYVFSDKSEATEGRVGVLRLGLC